MSDPSSTSARRRGRPSGRREGQRVSLLLSTLGLLRNHHWQDLSLRQVARRAGVTPALTHYYFGDRDGLIETLVVEQLAPRIDQLIAAARASIEHPQQALTTLMQRTCSLLAADSAWSRCIWIPLPAGRELRSRLRSSLAELISRAQDRQILRADLGPDYLADTLLGLMLFPFLDEAYGASDSGERVTRLLLQHVALLRDGVLRQPRVRLAT